MTRAKAAAIVIAAIVCALCAAAPVQAQDASGLAGRWTLESRSQSDAGGTRFRRGLDEEQRRGRGPDGQRWPRPAGSERQ